MNDPMKIKKILLTGAGGMLGLRLLPHLKSLFKKAAIYAVFHAPEDSTAEVFDCSALGDLTDSSFLESALENASPDLIINLAALTDVERCEREPERADEINHRVVAAMLERTPDVRFVQLSTDYVFGGAKGNYSPDDQTDPLSIYGKTKRAAEALVLQHSHNLVIRTSGVFDWLQERNLFGFFLRELSAGRQVNALAGCYYSPIWADDLARGVAGLIGAEVTGIQHYGGAERVDRLQFVQTIAEVFRFDPGLINAQELAEFNWSAARPIDSSLASEKSYALANAAPKPLKLAFAEIQLQLSAQAEALPNT